MIFASLEVDGQPEWVNTQIVSADYFDVLGVAAAARTHVPARRGPQARRRQRPRDQRAPVAAPLRGRPGRRRPRRRAEPAPVHDRRRGRGAVPRDDVRLRVRRLGAVLDDLGGAEPAPRGALRSRLAQPHPAAAGREPRPGPRGGRGARRASSRRRYPDTNRGIRHRVLPQSECPYGAQSVLGPVLRLLQAVSLGVLLIVVVNVANLSLASAAGRRKEIAIQLSLGAGRARLVRSLLAESLLLALVGGLLGMLLATQATRAVTLFLPARPPGVVLDFAVDGRALVFTLLLTLATGLAIGLATALRATRVVLHESLKEGGRSSGAGAHQRAAQQPGRHRDGAGARAADRRGVVPAGPAPGEADRARPRSRSRADREPADRDERLRPADRPRLLSRAAAAASRRSRRRGGRARELVPARAVRVQGDRRLRRGLPPAGRRGRDLRVRHRLGGLLRHAADPARGRPRLHRRRRPGLGAGRDRQRGLRRSLLARSRSRSDAASGRAASGGGSSA